MRLSVSFVLLATAIDLRLRSAAAEEDALTPKSAKDDKAEETDIDETKVVTLTPQNFDNFVQQPLTLVLFTVPWDKECQELEPEYEHAAGLLAKLEKPLFIGELNAQDNNNIQLFARLPEMDGYPSLKVYSNGEQHKNVDIPRTAEGIVAKMVELAGGEYKLPPGPVLTLTDATFNETLEAHPVLMVEFFAPSCVKCAQLDPHYRKVARTLAHEGSQLKLAKVDIAENVALEERFEIHDLPALKLFRHGTVYDYNGKLDEAGLDQYLYHAAKFGSTELTDVEQARNFVHSSLTRTVVGAFEAKEGPEWDDFERAIDLLRHDLQFAHTMSPEVVQDLGLTVGSVTMLTALPLQTKHASDSIMFPLTGLSDSEIKLKLLTRKWPLVGEISPGLLGQYQAEGAPLVIMFANLEDLSSKNDEFCRNKVVAVAKKHADAGGERVHFTIGDAKKMEKTLENFGLSVHDIEECAVGMFDALGNKFVLEADVTVGSVRKFVQASLKPGAVPYLKSARPPKKKAEKTALLKTVVGSTFAKIVQDPKKHVLIELYAPWCKHCMEVMPTLKELATKLKGEGDYVIAKMDATANDTPPGYPMEGYPAIYFVPMAFEGEEGMEAQEPVRYQGTTRTLNNFLKFMYDEGAEDLIKFKPASEGEDDDIIIHSTGKASEQ